MKYRPILLVIGIALVLSVFIFSLSLHGGVVSLKTSLGTKISVSYLKGNGTSVIITEDRDFALLPFFSFPKKGGIYSCSKGLTNLSATLAAISERFKINGVYALTKYYEFFKIPEIKRGEIFETFWNPSFLVFSLGIISISLAYSNKDGRKGLSYFIPFVSFLAGPFAPFAFLSLYLLISGVQENPKKPKISDLKKISWRDLLFLSASIIIFVSIARISPLFPLTLILSGIVFTLAFVRDSIGRIEGGILGGVSILFSALAPLHYYLLYSLPKILLSVLSVVIACSGGENKIIRGISASLIAFSSGL